ncbi:MAG: DNA-binding protein WhiA [Clostridia bacterium]|nr:DNA-binding protein WhiA [Clostridia bacterium]
MSFSSDIKQELNKTSNLVNKEMVKYELMGYLISGNIDVIPKNQLKFSTESDYNINRFSKLLSNLNIPHNIEVIGKTFVITLKIKNITSIIKYQNNKICIEEPIKQVKEEYLKAMIRGIFLGSGSINNPENKYHLEMVFHQEENLDYAIQILKKLDVKAKKMITQNKYSMYMKEGEEISRFLALIGANKAVMQFEEIRIQREMRGKVNRLVNCKAANLNKTINASVEQIAAIKKLQQTGEFNKLDDNLKEIANLRLENPDMTLVELGTLLQNPVRKIWRKL